MNKLDWIIIWTLTWHFLKTLVKVVVVLGILAAIVWFFVEAIVNA